jgi:nucleoid-associated protein YgaU
MTTDAKVGLLLGLVFIVIIAFVINGLPSFHKNASSNDLTNNYVTQVGNQPIGLADGNRQGLDLMNDTNTAFPLITSGKQGSITQVNNVIETTLPINETAAAEAVDSEQTLLAIDQTKIQADAAVAEAADSEIVPSGSAIYTVKKGDNLGQIAQNYYGTQGADRENVTKIAKANHLKSEAQIYIGQKLIIPNPASLTETNPSMFEKVKSVTKTLTNIDSKDSDSTSSGLRDYVVKSGDYPWKIAARELGSGTRYKEILKCNPNITEKTKLSIGMHLKLPAK